ncbi:MAG: hypothetical protein ACPG5T_00990 [Endozoicomonas sp.]
MPKSAKGAGSAQHYQQLHPTQDTPPKESVSEQLILDKKARFKRHTTRLSQKALKFIKYGKKNYEQYIEIRNRKIEKQGILTLKRQQVLKKAGNWEFMAKKLNAFFLEKALGQKEGQPDDFQQSLEAIAALKSLPEVGETLKYGIEGQQKTLVVMEADAFTRLNQEDIYHFYKEVLAHCDHKAALDYIQTTLPMSLEKYYLHRSHVKSLHNLIKRRALKLEHQGLRGSHGHKKAHGTRGIQKLTKRFMLGKKLYKNYAEVRAEKVKEQKKLAEARTTVLQYTDPQKLADRLNRQHAGKTKGQPEEKESLLSMVSMIAALKDRPEVGMQRSYVDHKGRQRTSLVMDRTAFEAIVQRDIQRVCQQTIEGCFETEALAHIESDLEAIENLQILDEAQSQALRNVLYVRKAELDIYEAWNKTSEMHMQWEKLSNKKQKKLKAEVHRSVVQYVDDVKREAAGKRGKEGLTPKENLERRVKRTLVKEVGSEAAFELARAFKPGDSQSEDGYSEKLSASKKFKKAVNMVNMASNLCTLENKQYRSARAFFIKHELGKNHGTRFEKDQVRSAFRAVATGPEMIFNKGFMPALLSRLGYQKGLLNEPYVNSSGVTDHNVGYTGGVVSMSDSLDFVSKGGYTKTTNLHAPSRWLYLVVAKEVADVSQHLDQTADQYALDSQEVMATYIPPERIVAAREVVADGTFRPMIWNPNFDAEGLGNKYVNNQDFVHFLNASSTQDITSQNVDNTMDLPVEPPGTAQPEESVDIDQNAGLRDRAQDYQAFVTSDRDKSAGAPLGGVSWHAKLAASKAEEIARYIRNRR